jgi:hypothetical protein
MDGCGSTCMHVPVCHSLSESVRITVVIVCIPVLRLVRVAWRHRVTNSELVLFLECFQGGHVSVCDEDGVRFDGDE